MSASNACISLLLYEWVFVAWLPERTTGLVEAQVQKLTTLLEDRQRIPAASSIQQSHASVPAPAHIIPNPSPTQATILPVAAAPVQASPEDRETQTKLVREVSYLRMLVDQSRANQSLSKDYHNLSSHGGQDLSRTLAQTIPTQHELVDKMVRFAAGEIGVVMNIHYEDEGTLFENSEMKVDVKLEKNLVLREGTLFLKGKLTLQNKTTDFLKNLILQIKDHGQSYKMMVKPSFSEVLVEPLASMTYSFLACPRNPQVKVNHPPVLVCSYTPPAGSLTSVSPVRPLSLSHLPLGLHRYFLADHQQTYDSHATVLATTKWEVFESEPFEITNIEMRTVENISRLFGNLVWIETPKNLTSPYSQILACCGTYRFQNLRLIITIKLVRPSQVRLAVTYPKEFPAALTLSGHVPLAGVSPHQSIRLTPDPSHPHSTYQTDTHNISSGPRDGVVSPPLDSVHDSRTLDRPADGQTVKPQ